MGADEIRFVSRPVESSKEKEYLREASSSADPSVEPWEKSSSKVGLLRELQAPIAEKILNAAADAFIAMDTRGCITEWNKAAEALFGWTRAEVLGRLVSETVIPARYRTAHEQGFQHYLMSGEGRSIGHPTQVKALHRDGHELHVELTRWVLKQGGRVQFYSFIRDISERLQRKKLEQDAYYDELTGLPNRRWLLEILGRSLDGKNLPNAAPGQSARELAVFFIDLDHFKRINDSLGHAAGDDVLVTVAKRLRETMRPEDTVGRLAGDEFVVLSPEMKTAHNASSTAERLLTAISAPIRLGMDSVFLTASIGIAFADEKTSPDAILGAADNAMYHAKSAGRAGYALFSPEMREEVASRLQVENELRLALERHELEVYFQPIVVAGTGLPAGTEALLRWRHPRRGLLSPAEFIPIAEEVGLIVPIGEWVVAEACRHAANWINNAPKGEQLYISINLSARQLAQADLVSVIDGILREAAFDPKRVQLGFEITESVVMRDPAATTAILRQLKSLGVRLSIDDFGTGYSSLAYLKRLPVDTLKIDRSFITPIAESQTDFRIVKTIVDLAHTLGLDVVAEGVETKAQAEAVTHAGVDLIQGFLYGHPHPFAALLPQSYDIL